MVAKAEVIWIDHEQLNWLCIVLIAYLYPRTIQPNLFDTNTNVLTVFMTSLLQHLCESTKSMKPNGNISTEWAKVLFFVWEKLLFYREVICFVINNLGNVFQTSRVIGLITILSNCMWNSDAKKVFELL